MNACPLTPILLVFTQTDENATGNVIGCKWNAPESLSTNKDGTLFSLQCKHARNISEWDICMICTYKYPSLSNRITTLYRHYRSKPTGPNYKNAIFRIPQLNWGHLFYSLYFITDCVLVQNEQMFKIEIFVMVIYQCLYSIYIYINISLY